ncbi:S46 family peptidase [Porphyrobacter sp. CACIAM 03H1]|uniref:S46 family peptidase n=1 Tax=Porphyrobacter sp. CACIAM 03H1 TaxID=2003315 RepID=UPI000B5A5F5D|nr:S46 family peptidase [Porphyrobacter sp. CACIAM 03H1]ASJ90509.1 peptidase S46 family protein [Porphyrobacter sp. CACIAM 03H1]
MKKFLLAGASALMLSAPAALHADEGMWLPSQTGAIAEDMKAAGLELDAQTLGDLQRPPLTAIASLGGCSAAFLSPQGLVATNHHCVAGSLQYNSSPENDYLTNGFLAKTLGDELPAAPGSRVYVIEDLRNVTADVLKGAEKLEGRARYDRLQANRTALIEACEKQANRRCDVRAYFGGAQYWLQQQLEIQDVRLVYAPAGGVGNFGGEKDNWMWPRHTGDFSFYRAYVAPDGSSAAFSKDNVPFKPKAWLPIAKEGVKEGDFVMVAGFPGTTERLRSAEEARFYYEELYPYQQRMLAEYGDRIDELTAGNQAATIAYAATLQGVENYEKKIAGQMAGAEAISLVAKKQAEEDAFRAWIKADPKREAQYGTALAELDKLIAEGNAAALADAKRGMLGRGQLYGAARQLYRWANEQAKPDKDREPGYQARDKAFMTQAMQRIERRYVQAIDQQLWADGIAEYRTLPAEDRNKSFDAFMEGRDLASLYATTELGNTAKRLEWMNKTPADFKASSDPFIQLAVATYDEAMQGEAEDKARSGHVQKARSKVMEARLAYAASQGKTMYPDANGSLRFTYGKVTGKAVDGQIWTPFTTAEGIVAKHTGRGEFDAPDKMIELIKAKDYGQYVAPALGTLPVDYLSTVDITNGNSGSSTLNAKGEFVGLAFDGTIEGVVSDWMYDPKINRTIHVDSRFMLWTMDKVDGADHLLKEMGVK